MYTNISRVRTLSGFDDTTNIEDRDIASKITIASGMVDSAIGYNYTLPLAYHYTNTIEFTGQGTGSGTMAVIINGTTYNVAVTSGAKPSAIADLFRVAAEDSADFIVDPLGFGAIVRIVSKTTSVSKSTAYAEVNITTAATTNGIAATIGTRAQRYPVVLEQLTAEIATALLFIDQYGVESQDTGKDGQTRMDVIDAKLQKLQGVHESGQRMVIFDEVSGAEIAGSTIGAVSSYPNDTSDESTTDPTSPQVWMNQEF